jgi:hypothetical protein
MLVDALFGLGLAVGSLLFTVTVFEMIGLGLTYRRDK